VRDRTSKGRRARSRAAAALNESYAAEDGDERASPHSITSSARARSVAGTVMPAPWRFSSTSSAARLLGRLGWTMMAAFPIGLAFYRRRLNVAEVP